MNLDAGSTAYTITGNEFDAVVTDNCGTPALSYVLTGATTSSGSTLDGVELNICTTAIS